MKHVIIKSLEYKDIFDDYEAVNIVELLRNIPTRNSIEIIAYFTAQLHSISGSNDKQIEFLRKWVNRFPDDIISKLEYYLTINRKIPGVVFNFINYPSSLMLMENILDNHNDLNMLEDLSVEQEIRLFKAYLYCTQKWVDKQLVCQETISTSTIGDFINMVLPIELPYKEIHEFRDFRIQFIKIAYFFQFCESDSIFREYLRMFLEEYGFSSWREYIKIILSLYISFVKEKENHAVITISEEHRSALDYINHLCIELNRFSVNHDFLPLRERPVYKINDNQYIVLNINFFVDKIFHSVLFEFSKVLINNGATYNGNKIVTFPNFKSIYSKLFTEEVLFYRVMKDCFFKPKLTIKSGKEMEGEIQNGSPDYYIRDRNKVYLFEFKDVILNAGIKHSYDIGKIIAEISKKLVKDSNGAPEGVSQLVNVIMKMRAGVFNAIDSCGYDNVTIFPILVYTDINFDGIGINYLLNKEFRKLLVDNNVKNQHLIKDIVMVHVDTLIKYQDFFKANKLKFNICLKEYINLSRQGGLFCEVGSFNKYLNKKVRNMEYKSPVKLRENLETLLDE